jgi:hypothetical protein
MSETELPDQKCGFQGYLPVHLRSTSYAVRKDNRDLGDVKASQVAKVINLDLEAVAVGLYVAKVYSLKHFSAKALKAAGAIPDRQVKKSPSVQATALANKPTQERPILYSSSRDIAGTDH